MRIETPQGGFNDIGFAVQHFPRYVQTHHWRHSHRFVEVNYIRRGRCTHHIGDRSFATGPGSFGITHYTQSHDLVTGADGVEVINLYVDAQRHLLPDVGSELSGALHQILPIHPSLRHRRNQFVHLQLDPAGPQDTLLDALLAEQSGRRAGYREAMLAHLRLLLVHCARHVRDHGLYPAQSEIGACELKMEELRRRLDSDLHLHVDLAVLGEEFGYTKHHLCRAFKAHTGTSIVSYQFTQRLDAVLRALRSSTQSVLDIAVDCGFADQSFFNRKFRAAMGMTPTEFRRSAQARP
ncbi:MAG: AraC family transcriptional regulator [Planctomycetes bacterium]|nr:AraC family transcriptional regulator [Planctomycetota bacterium]